MLFLGSVIHCLLYLTHIFSFFIKLNENAFTTEMEIVFALQGWKVKPCMACFQGLLPDPSYLIHGRIIRLAQMMLSPYNENGEIGEMEVISTE